jgi:hypothetical protein
MKMRATLKLNNAGAARNAIARKSLSSSQRSNPLTVVSLQDAPDHKNFPVACSLEGVIAISTNFELFLAKGGKNDGGTILRRDCHRRGPGRKAALDGFSESWA